MEQWLGGDHYFTPYSNLTGGIGSGLMLRFIINKASDANVGMVRDALEIRTGKKMTVAPVTAHDDFFQLSLSISLSLSLSLSFFLSQQRVK